TVFAWPGIGRLLYEGITFRDFPVVQAVVLLGGGMIVAVNLLIDILYAVIDPRIRLGAGGHEYALGRRQSAFALRLHPAGGLPPASGSHSGRLRFHGDLRRRARAPRS